MRGEEKREQGAYSSAGARGEALAVEEPGGEVAGSEEAPHHRRRRRIARARARAWRGRIDRRVGSRAAPLACLVGGWCAGEGIFALWW
jgi:hypothetical protein